MFELVYMAIKLMSAGFEPGHAIAPIPHCNWNCPLKKTAKATICPLQNLGKKLERKHTRRHLVQYRNCKLKQNVESTFYGTFKVHSKVTFQSRSTKQERLMLNLAWWMHLAILKHVTSKTCSNIRKLFRSKSKPEWIREKYRRRTVY